MTKLCKSCKVLQNSVTPGEKFFFKLFKTILKFEKACKNCKTVQNFEELCETVQKLRYFAELCNNYIQNDRSPLFLKN